jgi:hypothetical protein
MQVLELDPVSADEAIEEMENVGHDFFVYRDLESDEIQVCYLFGKYEPLLHCIKEAGRRKKRVASILRLLTRNCPIEGCMCSSNLAT